MQRTLSARHMGATGNLRAEGLHHQVGGSEGAFWKPFSRVATGFLRHSQPQTRKACRKIRGLGVLSWALDTLRKEALAKERREITLDSFLVQPGFHHPLPAEAASQDRRAKIREAHHLVGEREAVWVSEMASD
jgi:hypothetical protein